LHSGGDTGATDGPALFTFAPAAPPQTPQSRRGRRVAGTPPARAALNRARVGTPRRMSEANDREDDAVPDEEPRQTGVADQRPEENPEGQGAGGDKRPRSDEDGPDAPETSREGGPEDDPRRATGNPRAAG
jgi:hypothetical protein